MAGVELAYVGLGSNLNDPVGQVRRALQALAALPKTTLARASRLYANPPMGPADQPDYVNAVAALSTALPLTDFFGRLQAIELAQGRRRGDERWGPRTLDLDLLLWGEHRIETETLTVPHPGLHERGFVLFPLHEIAPGLLVPGQGPLSTLLSRVDGGDLRALPEDEFEKVEQ